MQRYTSTMSTITGLDLVGCVVRDVPASVEFYRDKLGLVPNMVHEQGAEFIMPDGNTFGLYNPGDMTPHVSMMFAVRDIQQAIAEFQARGLHASPPSESEVCHMAFAQDPDGNNVIIHQRKSKDETPAPAYARNGTSVNGIDISTYITKDPQKSLAFYRDMLGMTPTWIDEENGQGAEFTFEDGTTFGIWKPQDLASAPGGAFMFAVDDLPAKVAALRGKGVDVSEPLETPACHMAFAKDPDGNAVIIHKRK